MDLNLVIKLLVKNKEALDEILQELAEKYGIEVDTSDAETAI